MNVARTVGRTARKGPARGGPTAPRIRVERAAAPLALVLFLIALAIPRTANVLIGPLWVDATRLFLILATVPALLAMLSTVRLRVFDLFLILSVAWFIFCRAKNYGVGSAIEFGGLHFVMTIGTYALVQVTIKRAEQVEALFRVVFLLILLALPVAAFESLTGQRPIIDFFGSLFGTREAIQNDQRMGLFRAAVYFVHPILFGVFCATSFAFVWYSRGHAAERLFKSGVVGLCVFFSLSAGALLPLMLQLIMIAAERYTRGVPRRAMLFLWAGLGVFILLELFVGRGAFGFMSRYLTLNAETAWYRAFIWEYGMQNVFENPIFGFQWENWKRPAWMVKSSVDNFWLLTMMQAGFPGAILLGLAILTTLRAMMRRPDAELTDAHCRMRRASLYSLAAFCIAGATVAFFDAVPALFAFHLGVAAALARIDGRRPEVRAAEEGAEAEEGLTRPRNRLRAGARGKAAMPEPEPEPEPDPETAGGGRANLARTRRYRPRR